MSHIVMWYWPLLWCYNMFSNYVHLLLFSHIIVKMKKKPRKNWFILLKCVSCKHEVAFTLELLSQLVHERKRQDMVRKLLPQKSSRRNQHVSELPLYVRCERIESCNIYIGSIYMRILYNESGCCKIMR